MIDFSLQKRLYTSHGNMELTVDHKISNGDFVSLYGRSGSGKTSILRMLAGLMHPDNGFIITADGAWFDAGKGINIRPQKRKTGFVFQDYALFPNMNVRENIAFALPRNPATNTVDELLELTGLSRMAERKIQQLSGGQQQRVALARAVAMQPTLLLLDEPLSAIDDDLRRQLQDTLLVLHKRYQLTTVLVSHDIGEIVKLSDNILHLENGRLQHYASTAAFLQGIGYTSGLAGIVVETGGEYISVFLQQCIVQVPVDELSLVVYKKGATIDIYYDENSRPLIAARS